MAFYWEKLKMKTVRLRMCGSRKVIVAIIGVILVAYICINVFWFHKTHTNEINKNFRNKGFRLSATNPQEDTSKNNQDDINPFSISKVFPPVVKHGNYLNDMVIITTATSSFIDFTENWLTSIGRLGGSHPKIYIIAEDHKTYDILVRTRYLVDIYVIEAPQLEANSTLKFNSLAYRKFVNKRPRYILDVLESGRDVLFSDVDIVWFQRPYRYFNNDVDLLMLQDQGPPEPVIYCAGFVHYRSNKNTIEFMKRWISEIDSFKDPRPDQIVLNRLLKNKPFLKNQPVPKIKKQGLDQTRFVSGHYYFNATWRELHPWVKPFVLHNNWIEGADLKRDRFRDIGMWFL